MLRQNDVNKALRAWGAFGIPIDLKSMKQWGKIDGQSVIDYYNILAQKISTTCKAPKTKDN